MTAKQKVKFGDICYEVKVTTKDPISDGFDKYIGLEHLDSGSLKIKRWGSIVEDNPSFSRVFRKGQILFGKRRPYLKKAAIAEFDGICSGDIIVMEPSQSHIRSKLVPYIIQSQLLWDWAIRTSAGSLSPRTKFKDIAELIINVPSDDSQEKLENILKSIEIYKNHIEHAEESIVRLRRTARAELLFKGMPSIKYEKTQIGEQPESWKVLPLSELVDVNPSCSLTGITKVKFCEMALLQTDSPDILGDLEIRDTTGGGARFMNGDLLFARITPCAENGKMAVVNFLDDQEVGKGSTEYIVLRPKKVSSEYLYHLCRTARVREYAIKMMEGTTGRQRIPPSVFDEILVPLPLPEQMNEILIVLRGIESEIDKLHELNIKIDEMVHSLKLFFGL